MRRATFKRTNSPLQQLHKYQRQLLRCGAQGNIQSYLRHKIGWLRKRIDKLIGVLNPFNNPRLGAFLAGVATMSVASLSSVKAQTPTITSLAPTTNAFNVATESNISIGFSIPMDTSTLTAANISIFGSQTGFLSLNGVFNGNPTRIFTPNNAFKVGETISVSIFEAESSGGTPIANPTVYSFVTKALQGEADFDTYSTGGATSNDVAMGDLDGDGDIDAIVANTDNDSHIWLNNGDGTFDVQTFGSGDMQGVVLGDLDNDGDLDAIFARESEPLAIWLNNGDGSFVSSAHGTATNVSSDIALGDLDGDGDLDALVANDDSNPNEIWFNNGDATFAGATFDAVRSLAVAIGDLDGDGDLDAVFANRSTADHVWFNNGDGTFTSSGFGGGTSSGAALGDLDGNGSLDLLLARSDGNIIAINDGSGTFTTSSIGGGDCKGVAIGDLDGDGDLDAVFVSFGDNQVWLNNGDATFFTSNKLGGGVNYDLALGDLDGNGNLDVIISRNGNERVGLNHPGPLPKIVSLSPSTNATAAPITSTIDIEFNISMDVSTLTAANISIHGAQTGDLSQFGVFSGNPTRIFTPGDAFKFGEKVSVSIFGAESPVGRPIDDPFVYSFVAKTLEGNADFDTYSSGGATSNDVAMGDLDGDGDIDAIVANTDSDSHIWLNNGNGTFTIQTFGSGTMNGVVLGDLDKDGDLDAVFARDGEPPAIWLNNGDATFVSSVYGTNSNASEDLALGDLDGDGDLDFLIANTDSDPNEIWLNNGDMTFASDTFGAGECLAVAIGDLDGDGDLDAVFANRNAADYVWFNNGRGGFNSTSFGAGTSSGAALGDLDGDGDNDLILARSAGNIIGINDGSGTFTTTSSGGGDCKGVALGDMDGDGDLDAVFVSFGDNQVWINNGDATFLTSNKLGGGVNYDLALGDLDDNGNLDVIISRNGNERVGLNEVDPKITNLVPGTNANTAVRDAGIRISFNQIMDTGTLTTATVPTQANLIVHAMQTGHVSAAAAVSYTSNNKTVIIDPAQDFQAGEEVRVTITGATTRSGLLFKPYKVYGFRAAATGGVAEFSVKKLGDGRDAEVAIGDLNGDGDLDAIIASSVNSAQEIWINNGDGTFATSTFGAGSSRNVKMGDLDGDGDLDAVISNGSSQAQHIWINNGDGTFTTATLGAGNGNDLDIGDIDGDGDLDVIVVSSGAITPEIWFNNGNATFSSVGFGDDTNTIALGDLDGDGDLDALLGDEYYGRIYLWLNNGDGSFASSSSSGGTTEGLALGDLDGDGDLDAILVKRIGAQEIWLNNGDATFTTAAFGSGTSKDLALGDLDGDGDLDAIIANDNDQAQEIWLNNGDGTFESSEFGHGESNGIALGDLDGDGDIDAIIANDNGPQHIWINQLQPRITAINPTTNATAAARDSNIEIAFNQPMSTATLVADDVPTHANLIVYGHQTGHITTKAAISYSNGNASVTIDPEAKFKPGELISLSITNAASSLGDVIARPRVHQFRAEVYGGSGVFNSNSFGAGSSRGLAVGDLDGDGDLDAIVANASNQPQDIWINNGDGSFATSTFGDGNSRCVVLGDIDGDGDLDAIIGNSNGDAQEIWTNNGDASFTSSSFGAGSGHDLAAGDLDGDGDLDVIMANSGNGNMEIWLNNGDGSFNSSNIAHEGSTVAIGDLDGDGDLDALIEDEYYSSRYLWLNNGDGSFVTSSSGGNSAFDVALGDLDGDGDLDAVFANFRGAQHILINNGNATFSSTTFGSGTSTGIAMGDLDGDSDLDVIVANQSDEAQDIWLNNGDGTFTSSTFGAGSSRAVALGDLDGDGDLDAIIANFGGEAQEIWLNIPQSPTIASIVPSSTTASLSGMQITVTGEHFVSTSAQITTLDENGTTNGNRSLSLFASDFFGFSAVLPPGAVSTAGTLTLTVTNPSGSKSTNITVLNDTPRISTSQTIISFNEDQSTNLNVALADVWPGITGLVITPPTADLITIASITQIGATAATTQFHVTPVSNANGSIPLEFTVSDGELNSSTSFTLTINPVNDPPVLTGPVAATTNEDESTSTSITLNDIDTGFNNLILTATSSDVSIVSNAGISFGATGATTELFIDPVKNANGTALITVTVDDGEFTRSTSFNLTVNPVNDPPTIQANQSTITTNEDNATSTTVSIVDIDTPFSNVILTATSSDQSIVTNGGLSFGATGATTTLFVDPVANTNGNAQITVTVDDGEFTRSTSINLTVNPVNDPPTLSASGPVTTNEDESTTTNINLNDIDTGFNNLILTATSSDLTIVSSAGISFGATGATTSLFVDPVANANGNAQITVTVNDGEFIRSTSFNLIVNPVNDPPTLSASGPVTTNEDETTSTNINLNDIDTGFNNLILTATSSDVSIISNAGISFGATGPTTGLFIDPVANANGNAQITVTVDDGEFTRSTSFNLVVNPVNDPPTLSAAGSVTTNEDETTSTTIDLNDIDTGFNSLILTATSSDVTIVSNAGISLGTTGATISLFVDPAENANGNAIITVTVDDGEFTRTTSINLTVNPVNDPPVISTSNTAITTNEDTAGSTTFELLDFDTPLNRVILSATSSVQSVLPNNRITIGATGATTRLFYEPATNANGLTEITVYADDGEFVHSTTFTLNVAAVNDPPAITANSLKAYTREDVATTLSIALFDRDTPFSNLTLHATSENPALLVNNNIEFGTTAATVEVNMTPECGVTGTAIVTLVVSDGEFERTTEVCLTVQAIDPLSITGASRACPGFATQYTALPVDPDAAHFWDIEGGVIAGGQGTGSIQVIWENDPGTATIDLLRTALSGCTRATQFVATPAEALALMDYIIVEGGSGTSNVIANDLGDNMFIVAVEDPANGSVVTSASTVTYTPDPGFAGVEYFTYTARSLEGCTVTGSIVAISPGTVSANLNLEFVEVQQDRTNGVRGLQAAISTALSPDGKFVYAAGRNDHSIAIFERNTTNGTLTYRGRVRHGHNGVTGLKYVSDVAISPDGTRLYAAGYAQNALVVFERNTHTGNLTFVERKRKGDTDGTQTINGMKGPRGCAVSPDGQTVVATGYGDHSIAVFRFNKATGGLTFHEFYKNGVGDVLGMKQAFGLAFSLDGKHLYVAGSGNDAVAIFEHDLETGNMTFVGQVKDNSAGINGLDGVADVAVSPDGKHVYTAAYGDDAVALFNRSNTNGSLTFVDVYLDGDGAGSIDGLNGANGVTVSPDGSQVWAAGQIDDSMVLFERNQSTGELQFVEQVRDGVDGFEGLNGITMSALGPHSDFAYATGNSDDALTVIFRNRTPEANYDMPGTAVKNSTLVIKPLLNDSDADGHDLTIISKTNGALGTVAITGGGTTLDYSAGATTGADSFTYSISDGHGGSSTATVSLNVANSKQGLELATVDSKSGLEIKPNPARLETEVSFEISESGPATLRLSDLRGVEIHSLDLGELSGGKHLVKLDLHDASGRRLAAGVYLVEIEVEDSVHAVGKLVIVR